MRVAPFKSENVVITHLFFSLSLFLLKILNFHKNNRIIVEKSVRNFSRSSFFSPASTTVFVPFKNFSFLHFTHFAASSSKPGSSSSLSFSSFHSPEQLRRIRGWQIFTMQIKNNGTLFRSKWNPRFHSQRREKFILVWWDFSNISASRLPRLSLLLVLVLSHSLLSFTSLLQVHLVGSRHELGVMLMMMMESSSSAPLQLQSQPTKAKMNQTSCRRKIASLLLLDRCYTATRWHQREKKLPAPPHSSLSSVVVRRIFQHFIFSRKTFSDESKRFIVVVCGAISSLTQQTTIAGFVAEFISTLHLWCLCFHNPLWSICHSHLRFPPWVASSFVFSAFSLNTSSFNSFKLSDIFTAIFSRCVVAQAESMNGMFEE